MHKVCIIGDSHVAALRKGWAGIKSEFPDFVLTYFAAEEAPYEGLVIQDGSLLAANPKLAEMFELTSGGLRVIGPDYDLYILCGLKLTPQHALIVRKEYWSRHKDAIPVEVFETEFATAIEADLRRSQSARTLKMLRATTKAPIALIANPRPHEFDETVKNPPQSAIRSNRMLADAFETACRRIAEESAAVFLPQPGETLSSHNALNTKPVFAARSSDDPDRGHKNAAYGAIVLRDALSVMGPSIGSFRHASR